MKNRKFTFSGQSGTKNHCSAAQIWDEDGNSLAVIESTEDEKDATDVARLMHASPEMLEALEHYNRKPAHPLSTIHDKNPKHINVYKMEIRAWTKKFEELKNKALLKAKQ